MQSSDGCIWGWVRSWAINLCSQAGCHTHSLSQSFSGKQLCEPWNGREMPPPPSCHSRSCLSQCPNSWATPSTHKWPPFGGILRRWKWGGTSKHSPGLPTSPMPEEHWAHHPSWGYLQNPWPPPVTPHSQRSWLKEEEPYENTQFPPFFKSQPCCGLTAKKHSPAPLLYCHLPTCKGSHQEAQVYFQGNKNSENQTAMNYE